MMRTGIGHWLVASSPMRTGYAVVKIVAFITLAIALSLVSGWLYFQKFWRSIDLEK